MIDIEVFFSVDGQHLLNDRSFEATVAWLKKDWPDGEYTDFQVFGLILYPSRKTVVICDQCIINPVEDMSKEYDIDDFISQLKRLIGSIRKHESILSLATDLEICFRQSGCHFSEAGKVLEVCNPPRLLFGLWDTFGTWEDKYRSLIGSNLLSNTSYLSIADDLGRVLAKQMKEIFSYHSVTYRSALTQKEIVL
jgi:hypothetical protein